jgi:hypothetical protein
LIYIFYKKQDLFQIYIELKANDFKHND